MGTQAKLPYILPTPAAARAKLRDAVSRVREASTAVEGMKAHLKAMDLEFTAAENELAQAERNLLDAPEASREEAAADGDQGKAWHRFLLAQGGIENLRSALGEAKADLAEASGVLRSAREDLEAVRQGRRKR